MKGNNPIGMFDSGIGGTSIWREIWKLMPKENTIYLADSANAPYGEKSEEQILQLCIKNTELLISKDCKLIVVACNTATTNAIQYLREKYDVPFIGIEPAIKPAALNSKSKKVGVLATKGTLTSCLFHSTAENHANGIQIIEQEGTGLVSLIEKGHIKSDITKKLLEKYLVPMLDVGIDYLVLGCSHYPYLIPILKEILPEDIMIIDSGAAVARQTQSILKAHSIENLSGNDGVHQFYTNADISILELFLEKDTCRLKVDFLSF